MFKKLLVLGLVKELVSRGEEGHDYCVGEVRERMEGTGATTWHGCLLVVRREDLQSWNG